MRDPPIAWLADRVSRRLLIASGLVGVALSAMAVGIAQSYHQLVALLIVMGLLGASYHAPASSLLSSVFDRRERGRSLGLHIVGGSASFLITPVLAGAVASLASWNWAFIVLSLPALLTAVALSVVTREPEAVAVKAMANQAAESLPMTAIARALGGLLLAAVLAQVVGSSFTSFLPLFLADVHRVDPALAGAFAGVAIGTGVVGAPIGGALSDRLGRKPVILVSLGSAGPLIYLVAVAGYGPVLFAAMAAYGILMSVRMAPIESLIADVVPLNRRATVLGIYQFVGQETAGLATPLVGKLIDVVGAHSAFMLMAVVAVMLSALALLLRRRM